MHNQRIIDVENPLSITTLNDFIFCPASIYFHSIDGAADTLTYQDEYQINGSASHEKTDSGEYSDKKSVLQAIYVYCEKYGLYGKIDTFDIETGFLTERKKNIQHIYDGYIFQLYAQYFALCEMGYEVKRIRLYSYDENKMHTIPLPEDDPEMLKKFEQTIKDISTFTFDGFTQSNSLKCQKCIYEPMCSFSKVEEE